jgi:hypothetical protein
MDPITLVFCLFLWGVSAALICVHLRTWRQEALAGGDDLLGQYAWRKFRRRMQASIMIGIAGVAIFVGQWLPQRPVFYLVYWAGVVLWVIWIALLAMADFVATQHHFGRLHGQHLIEHARLKTELRRHDTRRNGHGGKKPAATRDEHRSPPT